MAGDSDGNLHPVYKVVEAVESTWSRDRPQQWQRTLLVVRALAEAGFLNGGRLIDGKYCVKEDAEGRG